MADTAHPFRSRTASAFFSLAGALFVALSNVATAGAQCNQVCSQNTSNTFFGDIAGAGTTGSGNSALGFGALSGNTSGNFNTAFGSNSLASDTTGANNTATGTFSLEFNSTGSNNTATGTFVLFENTEGSNNTATGYETLLSNTTGSNNTATGYQALFKNTDDDNTADGMQALQQNTTCFNNAASGSNSMRGNVGGYGNVANGAYSLFANTSGFRNTALGAAALYSNTTGNYNIAVGYFAGKFLGTGSNNIDIGSNGAAADANTIRIGDQATQTATYIAGIGGSAVIGADVVVDGTGRLGVIASSARYKKDVKDMGKTSEGLMKLRPVTFRYKDDERGTKQYGLVAEEVERVYPELVVYDANGKVESVRYSMLTSMLLNELQKQAAKALSQEREVQPQAQTIKQQVEQIAKLSAQFASAQLQIAELNARDATMRAAFEGRLLALEQTMRTRNGGRTLARALDQ